jgi:hemerythrin-like domain-containing protein
MFYMTHYPDVLHHPKEDLAFERIKQRAADSGRIVDELTEQHAY